MRRNTNSNNNQSKPSSSNFNKPKLFGMVGVLLIVLVLLILKFSKCNNSDVKTVTNDVPILDSPINTASTAIINLVEVNSITGSTANCNITFESIDQSQIKELGIVYNSSPNPSIEKYNKRKTKPNPLSNDIILLDSLQPNTMFFVRAYLIDINDKIFYSMDEKNFTTGNITIQPTETPNNTNKKIEPIKNNDLTNKINLSNANAGKVAFFKLNEDNPDLPDNRVYLWFNFKKDFIFDKYKIKIYGFKKNDKNIIDKSLATEVYSHEIKVSENQYNYYNKKFIFPINASNGSQFKLDEAAIKNIILNLYELIDNNKKKEANVSGVYLSFEFFNNNNLVGKTNISNLLTGSCKSSGACIIQPFND